MLNAAVSHCSDNNTVIAVAKRNPTKAANFLGGAYIGFGVKCALRDMLIAR